ncbi:MAG: DUF4342 domain-containing protein [Oscillospiraceae bacterium]|nr:DUF4342 domain-containing protein [Oscillospiraceae bacterium]
MATLELVEKLRKHANVSYDDAREALDACGDDILDAVIYLERAGKVQKPGNPGAYTTEKQNPKKKKHSPPKEDYYEPQGETFSQLAARFFKWVGRLIQKGNRNLFVIYCGKNDTASLPVTVFVLLLIFAFPLSMTLLVVGLFFGYRYRFRGKDIERISVNYVMDGVSGVADDIKRSVQNSIRKDVKTARDNIDEIRDEINEAVREVKDEITEIKRDLNDWE